VYTTFKLSRRVLKNEWRRQDHILKTRGYYHQEAWYETACLEGLIEDCQIDDKTRRTLIDGRPLLYMPNPSKPQKHTIHHTHRGGITKAYMNHKDTTQLISMYTNNTKLNNSTHERTTPQVRTHLAGILVQKSRITVHPGVSSNPILLTKLENLSKTNDDDIINTNTISLSTPNITEISPTTTPLYIEIYNTPDLPYLVGMSLVGMSSG
jgi:hypothetical protein